MGKTFIKGFGFVENNDELVPQKKTVKNDISNSKSAEVNIINTKRTSKPKRSN